MRNVLFLLGIILNLSVGQSLHYGCNGTLVPDFERRARNYIASNSDGDGDPYISDEYLGPGWFSVKNYRMPDSTNKPNVTQCGTENPIYIKGIHPLKEQLSGDVIIIVTACEMVSWNECENTRTVSVILCKGLFHYYLQRTSKNSAYCFDPPELQNVTVFDPAPTNVKFGALSVKPKLRFELKSGYLVPYNEYVCHESGSYNRTGLGLLYSTYWFTFGYADSRTVFVAFERKTEITSITDTDLINAGLKFGVNIECGVRVSKSMHGLQSDMVSSIEYYIGIRFKEKVINLPDNGSDIITMTPTIPFGCHAKENATRDKNTGKCSIRIVTNFPQEQCKLLKTNTGFSLAQLSDVQARCGAEVFGFYPFDISIESDFVMNSTSINVTSIYLSKSDATNHQVSLMTSSSGSHTFWKQQKLESVFVNTITNKGFKDSEENICYTRVDPHMMTSDKKEYNHQDSGGEFILYKHDDYPIEVQERTTPCNNNNAYCTCAVGIRAGGDVMVINLCGGLKEIGMTSCKDGRSLTIQKYNEYEYQIYTNIGTLIFVKIHTENYKNLMDVKIHMAPKDFNKTKGLCGIFDGKKDNDYHDRKGNWKDVSEKDFKEHWRLTFEDINLLKPGCSIPVGKWEDSVKSLFCMCNCTLETAASNAPVNCPADDHTAICSTSQYINCQVDYNVTSDWCNRFNERCKSGSKRHASHHDPETEQARRAKLADLESNIIFKRKHRETVNITNEMAENICRQALKQSMASNKTNVMMGLNLTQLVNECKYDVFIGQDTGWIGPAVVMMNDAVKAGYKRDANYTMTHEQDYDKFMAQTCPMNCSEKGECNEKGQCECNYGWFGPDCSNDVKEGPNIEDVEADGLCDQIYGSECRCFSVQANGLATNFSCKGQMRKRYFSGTTQNLTIEKVYGEYYNIYNGRCCFEERTKRSLEEGNNTAMGVNIHEIGAALSNDGINFGPAATIYIYDSTCVNFSKIQGSVSFAIKMNTCQINGLCYEENDFDVNDACKKCKPMKSQFSWSNDCPEEKSNEQSDSKVVIIVVCVGSFVLLVSVGICVYRWKIRESRSVDFADLNMPAPPMIHVENRPRRHNPRDLFAIENQQ